MNTQKKYKILVFDGGARQALPIIKGFHKLGCQVTAFCSGKMDVGYVYKYTDRKVIGIVDLADENATYESVKKEIETGYYDLVIPMADFFATILAKHKTELSQYVNVYVNDWAIYNLAIDKLHTMSICMKNGIPCPRTAIVKTADEIDYTEWEYPIVIKPRTSYGAKGFNIAYTREEMVTHFYMTEKKFGPSLIQEYISQTDKQYQVELVMDNHGECKSFVLMDKVRWYPINGGSSTMNVTVHDEKIQSDCIKLMKAIGWKGYASLDVIRDPRNGEGKIMEINPRMNGTAKICFAAGVNLCELILQNVFEKDVKPQLYYKDGIGLRYFHMDLLWFLKSRDRFKTRPSWFSMKNTVDEIFSWEDLRPGIVFAITAVGKLLHDKKIRNIE